MKIVYAQGYVWRATRRPLTASDTMYFSPHAIVRHYSCRSVDRFPRMYRDDNGPKMTTNMTQSDRDQKQNYLLRKSQTHRTVTKERSNTSSNSACPVRWCGISRETLHWLLAFIGWRKILSHYQRESTQNYNMVCNNYRRYL